MKTRIIIRAFTFKAFCYELMERLEEYPNAKLEKDSTHCGDNTDHNVFEFITVLEDDDK